MKTRIVRIGNSQGIRIPKPILEAAELKDEVELEVRDGRLIIAAVGRPRTGWDETFRSMSEKGDDRLLDDGALETSSWDEWES